MIEHKDWTFVPADIEPKDTIKLFTLYLEKVSLLTDAERNAYLRYFQFLSSPKVVYMPPTTGE